TASADAPAAAAQFESPPVAAAGERRETDPRARLHELALELVRTQNRRLLIEYLRLRRGGKVRVQSLGFRVQEDQKKWLSREVGSAYRAREEEIESWHL